MTNDLTELLKDIAGFDWDDGNKDKNLRKHNVGDTEAEQVFRNFPQVILEDLAHSQVENRYTILSVTDAGRNLIVSFTIRDTKIRVISARDQKRGAERKIYQSVNEAA